MNNAVLSQLFSIISLLITVYIFVITFRILITWVQGPYPQGAFIRFIASIVDPYLNFFRRFRFMRMGAIDLSPMLAIISLYLMRSLLSLSFSGMLRSPLDLVVVLLNWFFILISSIIRFFIFILIIRFFLTFLPESAGNPFVQGIDSLLQSIIARTIGYLIRKPVRYRYALLITAALFFVVNMIIGYVGNELVSSMSQLLG